MEEKHAIEVKDLVISYQNLKKTSIKKTLLHLKRQKPDRFVAVKGISFYVAKARSLVSSVRTEVEIHHTERTGWYLFSGQWFY